MTYDYRENMLMHGYPHVLHILHTYIIHDIHTYMYMSVKCLKEVENVCQALSSSFNFSQCLIDETHVRVLHVGFGRLALYAVASFPNKLDLKLKRC